MCAFVSGWVEGRCGTSSRVVVSLSLLRFTSGMSRSFRGVSCVSGFPQLYSRPLSRFFFWCPLFPFCVCVYACEGKRGASVFPRPLTPTAFPLLSPPPVLFTASHAHPGCNSVREGDNRGGQTGARARACLHECHPSLFHNLPPLLGLGFRFFFFLFGPLPCVCVFVLMLLLCHLEGSSRPQQREAVGSKECRARGGEEGRRELLRGRSPRLRHVRKATVCG